MYRPNRDELDPCPNCGDPVFRSHRCTAAARPAVPKPAHFDALVERARRQARGEDVPGDPYAQLLFEDVGL